MKLTGLSDHELLRGLVGLVTTERKCVARLVAYLVEIEERRLHLVDACSSLFDFCQRRLGMSEGEAFRRINAARLVRRFPSILGRLERGEIHLSALALLARHLTDDNHEALLGAAARKSKREVEELLAARFPKEDVPTLIRLLPPTSGAATDTRPTTASPSLHATPPLLSPAKALVEPLSAGRYKVQFTASAELRAKLERATQLMSHRSPSGDLTIVLGDALDLLIASLEKQRLGKASRPRRPKDAKTAPNTESANTGRVTRAALREVFERDGEQCSFRNEAGERCPARAFLEIDHVHARARGGDGTPENLRVLCRAHNQFAAEKTFGREHIARKVQLHRDRLRTKAPPPTRTESARTSGPEGITSPPERKKLAPMNAASDRGSIVELAIRALTSMGFWEPEARKAVFEVNEPPGDDGGSMTIENVLRRALAILTTAPTSSRPVLRRRVR